jgi:hypothetical protein
MLSVQGDSRRIAVRTIQISTSVFAAIWSQRREGEETEDAILSRVLGCPTNPLKAAEPLLIDGGGGVIDRRNGVEFPEGFRIFRRYKGREYVAHAQGGNWLRHDNMVLYPTLNQLNASIVEGMENVWNGNWKYRTPAGDVHSIDELRKP